MTGPRLDLGQSEREPRGWWFWVRTGLWAVTHPFSSTWRNPGVKETLAAYEADVRAITARQIADTLRGVDATKIMPHDTGPWVAEWSASDYADFIEREFGGHHA